MIRLYSNWFIFFFNVTITHCELIQKIKENNSSIVSITIWAEDKHMVSLFALIYFVHIQIHSVFVSIEIKKNPFEQTFHVFSMLILSFFMFYSNSHLLKFISKQKETLRTNFKQMFDYTFENTLGQFSFNHNEVYTYKKGGGV